MLWVTMKDGEVRRYNNVSSYNELNGWFRLGSRLPVHKNTIARLRMEDVKRLEYELPCEVIPAPTKRKR